MAAGIFVLFAKDVTPPESVKEGWLKVLRDFSMRFQGG